MIISDAAIKIKELLNKKGLLMKKLYVSMIAFLTFNATILSMELTTQKTTDAVPQSKAMFYLLKSGALITLNSNAVGLCDALSDISTYSQEDYDLIFLGDKVGQIPFNLNLSDHETIALFTTLNAIPDARKVEIDGKTVYLNEDVYTIIRNITIQHKLSIQSLINITNTCDFLICSTALNAYTRVLADNSKNLKSQGINILKQFSNNAGGVPFLKKHLKRMALGSKLNTYIQEFSIFDYIILNGLPTITPLCNIFAHANLTSIDGLESLTKLFNHQFSNVTLLDLASNYLELADPRKLTTFFNNLTQLKVLALSNNHFTQLPNNIFNNLTQLEQLILFDNQLTQLPENIFNNLTKLTLLGLDNNKLIQLPANIFNNLINLQQLSLSKNQLQYINPNALKSMSHLESLSLTGNFISKKNKQDLISVAKTINQMRASQGQRKLSIKF